jgi:hypothetical protein
MPILLTHGQLDPANVLVGYPDGDTYSSPQIVAIVDWSMACWMPMHWEQCVKPCDDTQQCIMQETNANVVSKAQDGTEVRTEGNGKAGLEAETEYRDAVRNFTLGAAP